MLHAKLRSSSVPTNAAIATFLTLCATVVPVGFASGQNAIDAKLARSLFAEAQMVSRPARDLWGVDLYGPMLFVDPASGEIVANMADTAGALKEQDGVFRGPLPEDMGVANTAVNWNGRRWTMLRWPLPNGRYARDVLLVHEMFHHVQPQLGLKGFDAANAHLDTEQGRKWLRLELRALQDALGLAGRERRDAVRDALAFRALRHAAFPKEVVEERQLEANEGTAEYTGVRTALEPGARMGWTVKALDEYESRAVNSSMVRNFAYATGPAYGLLLDAADYHWRAQMTDSTDFGDLAAAAYDIKLTDPEQLASSRAHLYGAERVIAEEAQRAQEKARQLAEFQKRFETGPILTLPPDEQFSYSFNPNAVAPFGDKGNVYLTAEIRAGWGRLEVDDGGVLLARGGKGIIGAVVPAPTDTTSTPIRGDGWILELADGWQLVPGERPGDMTVRRR